MEHYLPDLERVLREKHGICSDCAALFAAIMRISGIPCQMIYGDLRFEAGVKYRAWNLPWKEDVSAAQGGAMTHENQRQRPARPPCYGADWAK